MIIYSESYKKYVTGVMLNSYFLHHSKESCEKIQKSPLKLVNHFALLINTIYIVTALLLRTLTMLRMQVRLQRKLSES